MSNMRKADLNIIILRNTERPYPVDGGGNISSGLGVWQPLKMGCCEFMQHPIDCLFLFL